MEVIFLSSKTSSTLNVDVRTPDKNSLGFNTSSGSKN
jgi:hypothetical protein